MRLLRRHFLGATLSAAAHAAASPANAARPYRRIATEEGFSIPEVEAANARGVQQASTPGSPRARLRAAVMDLGDARIASMDEAGVALALLLLSAPGVQNLDAVEGTELARLVNDRAAQAVTRHTGRYAALAAIAPQSPSDAALELERAVRTLGAKGAVINSHTHGEYLDDRKFWPIFEAAQALDVPIYLHPREPSFGMPGPLAIPALRIGWGYGVETATHALRIILSGALDAFPRLRLVVGHLGEMIPFYFDRIDNRFAWELELNGLTPRAKRPPSRYFHDSIFLTSSGVNYWEPVRYTIARIGIERLLFAADHPYEDQAACVASAEKFPLSAKAKRQFFASNAERVFKL